MEKGKTIVPNNLDIEIVQIIKCDLYDADRKSEIIVNYSNVYKAPEDAYLKKEEFNKYYTAVVVFDENYNVIDYIHNIFDIYSHDGFPFLYTRVNYILDLNNDNFMDIISESRGYEGGSPVYVDRLSRINRIEREIDIYK